MRYILSRDEMKAADNRTSEEMYVPSAVLMERAAILTAGRVLKRLEKKGKRVLIVCGPGNNGGDGFATGRILLERGVDADIVFVGNEGKMSPLEHEQYLSVKALDENRIFIGGNDYLNYDVIVDAIFGISLSRPLEGEFLEAVRNINESRKRGAYVISIDIPSGVDADLGLIMGEAVEADETLVCAFLKKGNVLFPGAGKCGELILGDIGITEKSLIKSPKVLYFDDNEIMLPARRADTNKGSYGKVLIFAGSKDIAGAAVLSAKAALRTGCGMVRVLTHENNRAVLQTSCPEVLVSTYSDSSFGGDSYQTSLFDAGMSPDLKDTVMKAVDWCDVIVAGPGIGTDERSESLLKLILDNSAERPVVLDADALNIISKDTDILEGRKGDIVITPHLMEMSRLSGIPVPEIKSRILDVAYDFTMLYHVITVLKDSRTVTALPDGSRVINLNGNNGMATAGSGDVLTGIIASLIAQGVRPDMAACLGAALHGAAGDRAKREKGAHALMASDIIDNIR